jgi:uncharacterized membrane protein YedE/YeeE
MTTSTTQRGDSGRLESGTIALFVIAILVISLLIQAATHTRQAILFLMGVGIGICLLQAMFGFTGGWRSFIRDRNSAGVRAQIFLLGLTSLLLFPVLGGAFENIHAAGAVSPVGYSVLIGAFLFGMGMQLGGGCGSGTLFTMGQGQVDMLVTLLFFIIGATVASSHLGWWQSLGDIGSISLISKFGWVPALAITAACLLLLYLIAVTLDKRRNQSLSPVFTPVARTQLINTLLFGKWPLWWAVIGLAVFNLLTVLVAGHPWSITFALSLWGTKIWTALGGDISQWTYWQNAYPATALNNSVLLDTTSLMDFGLILGAGLAAALAGRFAPPTRMKRNKWFAVIIGGLLLGYGARLAFGCNIGALLAGISSGSVHGWLWLVSGFIGNIVGTRVRVTIGLDKPY